MPLIVRIREAGGVAADKVNVLLVPLMAPVIVPLLLESLLKVAPRYPRVII
jgi:hypothetical protein